MMYNLIIIGVIALSLVVLLVSIVKRYKRCPSDKLLVVYGKTGKNSTGGTSTARVTHGGGQFIWPIIQDYEFLDLKPISIEVNLKNALSKQNIRIDVPSTFTVAISADEKVRQNAAERLLGLGVKDIATLAQDIIFGQMRLVIATMDIEEINSDRDKFLTNIQNNLEDELQKIGIKLINVNVTDISDESGYIEALGKEAAAKAINEAKKSVAEKNRDGQIGVASAEKEQRIKVSAADADAIIGEKIAEQKQRTETSAANAKAIEGENIAAIDIANTTANRKVKEAEANKLSFTAQKVKAAEALTDSYEAERVSEVKRAEKDKATQFANIVIPAQIDKEKIEIDAEAIAEQKRRIAKGDADAIFAKMEAEAKGNYEILSKQAEGFNKMVEAAGSADKAVQMMIADKFDRLLEIQVEAIKNIKIDKVTVWDNGSNDNGSTSTGNFMKGLFGMLPPMTELFKQAGSEIPAVFQGSAQKAEAEKNIENTKEPKK